MAVFQRNSCSLDFAELKLGWNTRLSRVYEDWRIARKSPKLQPSSGTLLLEPFR